MKLLKEIGIGLSLVVLFLLVAPKTKANEQNKTTVVTFSVAVEVPGASTQTLPAGTYLFKALESSPDRDIIQISNQDGTQVFATFLGVPNSRLKAPDLVTVMFTGRPAADPQALEAWYYPGRAWGDQVVYEKARATQLAKETNGPVLSTPVVLASSSVDVLKTAAIEAVNPAGETVAIAQVVDAPSMVAPALNVATEPVVAATPMPVAAAEPTVAVATPPAPETVTATEPPVSSGPTVAVVPPPAAEPTVAEAALPAPAPTVAVEPTVADVPAAAPEPVAVEAPPATPAPTVTAEPAATASPEVASATLPSTASFLPLIGMAGLLMLGAGILMSSLMKRKA